MITPFGQVGVTTRHEEHDDVGSDHAPAIGGSVVFLSCLDRQPDTGSGLKGIVVCRCIHTGRCVSGAVRLA